ncbi:MAG: hypothetical protein LUQ42_04185 [Methanomicrobiales archaeon]|nr:hypothetical protein [Methanomicrobiales archaeon]
MIVPMRKATILVREGDAEAAVKDLRTMGVLHVEHQNPPEGRDVAAVQEKVALIHAATDVLNRVLSQNRGLPPQKEIAGDWEAEARRIIELGRRRDELESSTRSLTGQILEWERWGDVDAGQVDNLRRNGVFLKLYRFPVTELARFPGDVVVKTVFTEGEMAHCVAISRREFDFPFPEIPPPAQRVSLLKERLAENAKAAEAIQAGIAASTGYAEALSGKERELEQEIRFRQVVNGMGGEGPIRYVTGYIPVDMEERLTAEAKQRQWGIFVTDPSELDTVPVLLRNPRWVSLIAPVLRLLGLSPGYRELDVSPLFLIFFSLFFGILIGDAGYGLVYILLTFGIATWLRRTDRLTPELKTTITLFYLLGSCAVIWGILTGTFFGQEWLRSLGYQPPLPQLNDAETMETFCFFLGALHLSLAHTWRIVLKYPSLTALADAGYICILWSAFFVAETLILGEDFPAMGYWLVAVGVALVVLFTNPQRNVLRGIGEGLMTIALSFMNNITDVISYIRLFAVGLAGLAIAETTNMLAGQFGTGIVAVVAGIVILIFGHTLNIILGPMSVLVHGVRLNVLEFSGHANVTWSGVAFEPLKE